MGMPVGIDVYDVDGAATAPAALDRAYAWLREVDALFSTYRDDSEISRLNRGELGRSDVSAEVAWVLERCEQLRVATAGYFDMAAPADGSLDPSGLVKGWSVDRAGALLDAAGIGNYSINAGGDVLLQGRPLPEPRWRVGIQHPRDRHAVAAVLVVTGGGIATSGAYERGAHIIDPITGAEPGGVLSVTVIGPELATADAYATAAYAMGARGPDWTATLDGYDAMTIMADGRVLLTPGFPPTDGSG